MRRCLFAGDDAAEEAASHEVVKDGKSEDRSRLTASEKTTAGEATEVQPQQQLTTPPAPSLEEIAENYIASLGDGNKALETFVLGKYRHDQGSNDPDIDILYADQTTMYQTLNDYCSLPQAPLMSDDSVPSTPTPVSASTSALYV